MKDYEELIMELEMKKAVWFKKLKEADSTEKGMVARGALHAINELIEKYEDEYESL